MNRSDKVCALCAHYSGKDAPAGTPPGQGLCKGYDGGPVRKIDLVAFDQKFCVLFRVAGADLAARRQYVEKMKGSV